MINRYRGIAPDSVLTELETLACVLKGRSMQHVNSTRTGGGVAEILRSLVPLTQSLGMGVQWEVIAGSPQFFEVTKKLHNALQGADVEIPPADVQLYLDTLQENARELKLDADVVMIHDPQPAFLIDFSTFNRQQAVWRCHIDLSRPSPPAWRFLRRAVSRYAMAVFHVPAFAQVDLAIPQVIIPPSIDPLTDKNCDLPPEEIAAVLERFRIDPRRPILLQVSRFDRFKDPLGVIAAFRQVRQHFDCQLVLAGAGAPDDPEGPRVRAEIEETCAGDAEIFLLSDPSDREVNALQRAALIVLQKSVREGFGLTVTEAMWKGKPVIGGAVGGIPSQIIHGVTGFLVHSAEGAAFRLRYLLGHPELAREMGERAREYVRQHFLITRHARDYLFLMLNLLEGKSDQPMLLPARTGPILLGKKPRESA